MDSGTETCQAGKALDTHPRSQNHVQIAAHPPEDATDDVFTFYFCFSLLVVVLIIVVVLNIEEDIL